MDATVVIGLLVLALLFGGGGQSQDSDYVVTVSAAEERLLARLIDVEARGESYRGKVAVGAVVVNRMRDPRFPNRLQAVVYEPRQFYTAGLPNHPVPSPDAVSAAKAALRGEDPTGGALFFYNPDLAVTNDWWASRPARMRIGNHVFSQ